MTGLSSSDKHRILDILCAAFDANRSVNAIAGTAAGRARRIRALMDYSIETCHRFGRIYLSDDRVACALVLYPDLKHISPATLLLDLGLVARCIGLRRLRPTLQREARIKARHPATPFTYLWFIGVDPAVQGHGHGSRLLQTVLDDSSELGRPVCLETSTEANLPWYRAFGFAPYYAAPAPFPLHFLRHG